jgi:hypothetical protein
MADKKISQLTAASTPLAGTEVLPIVQSSTTVKVAIDDLTVKNIRSNATNGLLQLAGPAAAATRIMTVPDANFTAARTDAANSFTGNQTLGTGNLVIGTSGKGIDFSATAGTGTSELLADYEEGIWSPTIIGATTAGTATYDVRNTSYTKIGRLVHVEAYMVYSAGTGVGDLRIGNLPYAVENTYFTYTPIVCRQSSIAVPLTEQIYGRAEPGTSYIAMYSVTDAGAQTPLTYDGDAFIAFQANYTAA